MKMPIRVTSRPTVRLLLHSLPLLLHLLIPLLAMFLLPLATADCPSLCECKWKNGKESVRCHNANLTEIPPRLDAGTQVLDLQRNAITRLDGDEFSTVNLLNLQKIYLIDCQVTHLHRYAFRNLHNLVELDLSENRLSAVPSHVFDSMAELRELRLSGNPVLRLDNLAFNGLEHLVRLELSNCHIRRIELRAFEGVRQSLEWLKLDGNELINVQPAALTILNNLHGIELTRNNWNCTCSLRPLREWMLQENIPYEVTPVCAQPERLNGRPWSRMDVDEFACSPAIVALPNGPSSSSSGSSSAGTGAASAATGGVGGGEAPPTVTVKAIEGQNVTIGCGIVAGNPDPTIRWMFRNRVIVGNVSLRSTSSHATAAFPPLSSPETSSSSAAAMTTLDTRKKFYHHLDRTTANVTIAWIDSHDSGVYKCIAENEAGRSEATISVLVYSRHFLIDSNNNVIEASVALAHSNNRFIFIISTAVAVLFVVLSLLLAICYYTVHRKNAGAATGAGSGGGGEVTSNHRHHNHEQQPLQSNRKKGWRFHFLLCRTGRSESYEKIEMLSRANPMAMMPVPRMEEREPCKMYCERSVTGSEADDGGQFPVAPSSVQDKRRAMSLNLSTESTEEQRKRQAAAIAEAVKMSSHHHRRRNNGDYYSNVPTIGDEERTVDTADVQDLMGSSQLFIAKHQAAGAVISASAETQQFQWLNGPSKSFLPPQKPPPDELGIASPPSTSSSSTVNVPHHLQKQNNWKKVNGNSSSGGAGNGLPLPLRGNINLSAAVANFSHPLADLSATSATTTRSVDDKPLINIGAVTTECGLVVVEEQEEQQIMGGSRSMEDVIRHHVMRKRILTETETENGDDGGGGGRGGPLNNAKGIVIYTTAKAKEGDEGRESLTATPVATSKAIITAGGYTDCQTRNRGMAEVSASDDKLGRLSPTLNSIMRNDENFDLFDVKSNLDDFYVKQLNYDYHQLQRQQQLLLQSHKLLTGDREFSGTARNQYNFCSLPRKRTAYEPKTTNNLMGFGSITLTTTDDDEDLFDAPLEDSLFRTAATQQQHQQQRQRSSSELDLMMSSLETSSSVAGTKNTYNYNNGLSFIMASPPDGEDKNNGRPGGDRGVIIKALGDNNKATPLLNFPSSTATGGMATGSGNGTTTGLSMEGGIFPSNCGSPSIVMGGGAGGVMPLGVSSILSPTTTAASSSSPSSSASSSVVTRTTTGTNGSVKSGVGGDYDYHAAQLEMFLGEYKRLQQQLCKMKETCDSIRRTEELYGGGGGGGAKGKRNKPVSISSALAGLGLGSSSSGGGGNEESMSGAASHQYYPMNSKLMEKSNVLLPSSSSSSSSGGVGGGSTKTPKSLSMGNKHKSSYPGATPEPPPYWMHRNELLKGMQSQLELNSQPSHPQQIFNTSAAAGLGTNHLLVQPQRMSNDNNISINGESGGGGGSSS